MGDLVDFSQLQILAEIVLALVLGGLVGFERELANKPAGLRTHMLVAGASTLLVAAASIAAEQLGQQLGSSFIQADPVRIIEAVVTGISFLGAGTIIIHRQAKTQVEGLTTAASLLTVAAIGICVALAQWTLAIGTTLLVLMALRGVNIIEHRALKSEPVEQKPDSSVQKEGEPSVSPRKHVSGSPT